MMSLLNRSSTLWLPFIAGSCLVSFVASCDQAPDSIRSEIGADSDLGTSPIGNDELIRMTFWRLAADRPDQITIEIKPDRTLRLLRYDVDWSSTQPDVDERVLASTTLDASLFDELRSRLSAYRPAELDRTGVSHFPRGCGMIFHDTALANIEFTNVNGEHGFFILQSGCHSASANTVEQDLREIVSMLPNMEGVEGYSLFD